MRTSSLTTLAASLLLGFCISASAAPMTKVEYKAAKASISAQLKADKITCDAQTANAKDICLEEAKGRDNVALAELEAQYEPSTKHSYQVNVAKADAAFAVAKEKCDDQAGNPKDVCRTEAKSAHTAALAEAKLTEKTVQNNKAADKTINAAEDKAADKNASARKDATSDIREAQYKSAAEKCNAFASDAKSKCIAEAKTTYGQN
ncbi:hypothetical protein DIC66_08415 [Rhodoferax lacus]|uniref:Cell envelope biogenesis protein TolA n=1 Tax=Rhodoferax lacus TaxID=2184758 RepID=A0A3E1RCR5_9BURK|nr:hypothetical protein [Rhodoferax lacus]RFO97157.1 hypothetical protein DIC66_08415 [Rhodoferax lacus]